MHEDGTWWEQYLHLLSNPAHWMFEITLVILIDLLVLGVGWRYVKKWVKRHDREHHGNEGSST